MGTILRRHEERDQNRKDFNTLCNKSIHLSIAIKENNLNYYEKYYEI